MALGSYGAFSIPPVEFKTIRNVVVGVLREEQYVLQRQRAGRDEMRVVGLRGNAVLATIVTAVPLVGLFGFGTRVRATVTCRKSLTAAASDYRLTIHVEPINETTDEVEGDWAPNNLRVERMGDHAQAKRCFQRLVEALEASDVV